MNYYLHVLRRLNKIFPNQFLLKVNKSHIQPKLDYGLSIWECTSEGNLDRVQRIQNFCARIICNNYDYINTRGIDLVKSLKLQTIREHRDYFLGVFMFKCIHGLAFHYLSNDVTMVVDIHGCNTWSSKNMDLYVPRCTKELCKRSFWYKGSMLWNDLPDILEESSSLDVFESNYRFIIGWQISEYIWVYWSVDLHFLISHIFPYCSYILLRHKCISWIMMFVLNSQGFLQEDFVLYFRIIYRTFYGMTFILCWYVICLFVKCGIILCFRQGSKVEQFHWLVIPCINMFEKKKYSVLFCIPIVNYRY